MPHLAARLVCFCLSKQYSTPSLLTLLATARAKAVANKQTPSFQSQLQSTFLLNAGILSLPLPSVTIFCRCLLHPSLSLFSLCQHVNYQSLALPKHTLLLSVFAAISQVFGNSLTTAITTTTNTTRTTSSASAAIILRVNSDNISSPDTKCIDNNNKSVSVPAV